MPAHPALVLRRGRGRSRRRESGGRKLAAPDSLSTLPVAQMVPIAPADLGAAGHAFWEHVWSSCASISAASDWEYVAECARLVDDLELARCRHRRTRDSRDCRFAVALSHAVSETLTALGLDSDGQAKLGFAARPRIRISASHDR
jgi:hypothetical protein